MSEGTGFKKILVAVDGSQKASEAVIVAAGLARAVGGDLTVLHVVHIPFTAYGEGAEGTMDRLQAEARSDGRRFASEAAAAAKEQGVGRVTQAIVEDLRSPSRGITEYAKKNGIDLIVVGTRGLGGFKRLLLGSVATGVLSYAHCSVLVVR